MMKNQDGQTSSEYIFIILSALVIVMIFRYMAEKKLEKVTRENQDKINKTQDLSPRPQVNKSEQSYREHTGFRAK